LAGTPAASRRVIAEARGCRPANFGGSANAASLTELSGHAKGVLAAIFLPPTYIVVEGAVPILISWSTN
jgi:hypothetical protein